VSSGAEPLGKRRHGELGRGALGEEAARDSLTDERGVVIGRVQRQAPQAPLAHVLRDEPREEVGRAGTGRRGRY
jgi:hypothetical protein